MSDSHDSAKARPPKARNERTCAGCSKHAPAEELVRVVHDPSSGELAVDLAGSSFGRGSHVHPSPDCVKKAAKSGFSRSFKTQITVDPAKVGADIVAAADRRIEGLLVGARRGGQLALGTDAVKEAGEKSELIVVAVDAAAAAKLTEVSRAIDRGRAIAWGRKELLGGLLRGPEKEVAVVAVLHPGVAESIANTYRMSGPFRTDSRAEGAGAVRSMEAWSSSSEVR